MECRWIAETKSQYEDRTTEGAGEYWKCIEITILRIRQCLGSVYARLWKDSIRSGGIAEDEIEPWNRRAAKKCYWEVLQWPPLEQTNHWAQKVRANLFLSERLCKCWEGKIDLLIIREERSWWHARTASSQTKQRRNHPEAKAIISITEFAQTSPKRSWRASKT